MYLLIGHRLLPPPHLWPRVAYKGKTTRLENFIYHKNNFYLRHGGVSFFILAVCAVIFNTISLMKMALARRDLNPGLSVFTLKG